MATIADRYRRLSDAFAVTIAGVAPDQWSSPSPCDEWTARDVVGHVVGTQGMFLGFVGREVGDGPSVEDDPAGAWGHARAAVQAALDDPAVAGTEFEGLLGTSRLDASVDRFLSTDLVIHRWDLAEATGQPLQLDPGDMADVRASMADLADRMRGPGAIGPELEPPPGADEQTVFLAYFGRRA